MVISDNAHKTTVGKCILTNELIIFIEKLSILFEDLNVSSKGAQDIIETKYWNLKPSNIKDYMINLSV